MKTKEEFINILASDKELIETTLQGSNIYICVDYTESIRIDLNNQTVYYGNEIESEEDYKTELSKVYDKYVELYTKY